MMSRIGQKRWVIVGRMCEESRTGGIDAGVEAWRHGGMAV